jgi:hypothetical protein
MEMRRLTAVLAGLAGLLLIVAMGCENKPEEGASPSAAAPAAGGAEGGAPAAGAPAAAPAGAPAAAPAPPGPATDK